MRLRSGIERRLVDAVALVLAGTTGCWTQARETTPPPPPPPPPGDKVTFATSPDGEGAAGTPSPFVLQADPQHNPSGVCAEYKALVPVDIRAAKRAPGPVHAAGPGGSVPDVGTWNAATNEVECRIVRGQQPGEVMVLHTPTCCPTGRGNRPCPPGQLIDVPGEHVLVEQVRIRPDGSIANRTFQWNGIGVDNEPRHYCGRRPEGLAFGDGERHESAIGVALAAMAELEAASVPAFERLARELAHHGAPAELVRRAWLAMGDEIRHARVMSALALEHGCTPRAIEVPHVPIRPLEAIARENAVEGCVREAYGALVASFQAERAAPELRAAFAAIAVDERSHAALSEDVDAWITGRLDPAARGDLCIERTRGQHELRASLAAHSACNTLGLPGSDDARALFDAYFAAA